MCSRYLFRRGVAPHVMFPSVVCFAFCFAILSIMFRLGAFEVGQIKAHMHHGLSGADIVRIMKKPDGKTPWSQQAVYDAMNKLEENVEWRGEREIGSGPARKTDKAQDKALEKFVNKNKGKQKVTVKVLRRAFAWTRGVGNSLLEERLHEAGMKWLRRRRKTIVTQAYLQERIDYCRSVVAKWQSTLDTWAYTDGTCFYLDRTAAENEETQMAALGGWVWRYSDCRDALFQENLGPSSYKKAQGTPVRVWGMLAEGILYIHILDEGDVMDNVLYEELVEDKFQEWMGSCRYLVQDFERCLRSEGAMNAFRKLGIELVEGYPRCSQDFNAIENIWNLLRERLHTTLPLGLETRDAFIVRLKKAVVWLNRNKTSSIWHFARNQKERCKECLESEPPGGRTSW